MGKLVDRERESIALCPLYYQPYNFKRTGCKGCPTEEDGIYQGVEIIQKSDYVDDLFNRIIIISIGNHRRSYKMHTKNSFGKLSHLELIKDLGMGKKEIYGAIWVYGPHKEPSLKSVAVMVPGGKWKLL